MIDSLLQQTTIPLLEQVTAFGQRRHQVLAGNIANIDTPGYRTRDLPMHDFEKALQQAVQARRDNVQGLPQPLGSLGFSVQSPGMSLPEGESLLPEIQPAPQTHTWSRPQKEIAEYFPASLYEAKPSEPRNLTFHDGGNRSIERESMEMSKNTSMQSFAIEVMLSQMRMLESVISERVV